MKVHFAEREEPEMENREEAQQLLCDVLAVRSVNGKDDEGKVAEYLAEYFRKSGIDAKVDRIDVTHANVRAVLHGEDSDRKIFCGTAIWIQYPMDL